MKTGGDERGMRIGNGCKPLGVAALQIDCFKNGVILGHVYFVVKTTHLKSESKNSVLMAKSPKILLYPTTFPSKSLKVLKLTKIKKFHFFDLWTEG